MSQIMIGLKLLHSQKCLRAGRRPADAFFLACFYSVYYGILLKLPKFAFSTIWKWRNALAYAWLEETGWDYRIHPDFWVCA
jgi:hypothetical protein